MNTQPVIFNKNLGVLARMLERLDQSREATDAEQYRTLVARLAAELEAAPHDASLEAVLAKFPSAAQLYENLNYQHAGLCRSSLEPALAAEIAARDAIGNARRRAAQGPAAAQA